MTSYWRTLTILLATLSFAAACTKESPKTQVKPRGGARVAPDGKVTQAGATNEELAKLKARQKGQGSEGQDNAGSGEADIKEGDIKIGGADQVVTNDGLIGEGGGDVNADFELRPSRDHYMQPTIFTGARTEDNYLFTDAKNDDVMPYLVDMTNKLTGELKQASLEMAIRIRNLEVRPNIYKSNGRNQNVTVKVSILDGKKTISIGLAGVLDANRRAQLEQVSGPQGGYSFKATLRCVDVDDLSCQNTIVRLDQVKDGAVLRRVYMVHRWGNAAFFMTDSEYANHSMFLNPSHNELSQYLANTILYKRQLMGTANGPFDAKKIDPMPRARILGLKTWAVAYGPAHFELKFISERFNGESQAGELVFSGDLVSRENNQELVRQISVSGRVGPSCYDYAGGIRHVDLTGNDGHGNLGLRIKFTGENPAAVMNLEFRTRINDTILGEPKQPPVEPSPQK